MPFNHILLGGAQPTYRLFITSDLFDEYDVSAAVLATYNRVTQAGDLVILDIAANVEMVPANTATFAIDGNELHDGAHLLIVLHSEVYIAGRGGAGGAGGNAGWQFEFPAQGVTFSGQNGQPGGAAIRLGCRTTVIGTTNPQNSNIVKGWPGGGGGGGRATSGSAVHPGCGGGGGAGFGPGGIAGDRIIVDGPSSGENANPGAIGDFINNRGLGGLSTLGADGGNGADDGGSAGAGQAGTGGAVGGSAGPDTASAVITQGFPFAFSGTGLNIEGPVT